MTPYDNNLIERCEERIKSLRSDGDYGAAMDMQNLLYRFKELAMVDLDEVEKLVQFRCDIRDSNVPYANPNVRERDAAELRVKIGYTTQHLNTEGEG